MNAHILADDGTIINTIVVDSIDALPGIVIVDASTGGSIGDKIVDGVVIPKPADAVSASVKIEEIKEALKAIDAKRIRPLAEGDTAYLANLNAQATALRAELDQLKQDTGG